MLTVSNTFIILIASLFVILLYKYFTRNFNYWKEQNVPFQKPWPLFGNFFHTFIFRKSISTLLWDFYNQHKFPYFGIFIFNQPHFVVKDLDLIKHILIKDFNYFYDRAATVDENGDSLVSKVLFFSKNPEWKFIRSKITPVFTTGKIKGMIKLLNQAAEEMKSYLNKQLNQGPIEIREVCLKYSTNVITSCAFGLNANSFEENNSQFRRAGQKLFELNWLTTIRHVCHFLIPNTAKRFKMRFIDDSVADFLRCIFWQTIEDRENKNRRRNDLIDIINQIRKETSTDDNIKFEGDTVVAQAVQFFAGFETIGSTISFALYELCQAPNIQNKLRLEIKESISEHGGLTYEAVQNMTYLDMVVSETLRKYPAVPFLNRKCAKDYKIPNTNIILKKDSSIYITLFGLHYDCKYFPNPERFSPERFSAENKEKIPNFSYLPFGDGPRNCIAERFGLLVTKLGVAHIISEFVVEKSHNLRIPIQFSQMTLFLSPSSGINLKFKTISSEKGGIFNE